VVTTGTVTSLAGSYCTAGTQSVVVPVGVRAPSRQLLALATELAGSGPGPTVIRTDRGEGVEAVVRAAAATADPLVCLAIDGHTSFGRVRFDGVTTELLRRLSCPVLAVGPQCRPDAGLFQAELFVCVDCSDRSEAILPLASSWAQALGLHLWLLNVLSPMDGAGLGMAGALGAELLSSGRVARLARAMADDGLQVDWEVLHGSHPSMALAAHAASSRTAVLALNSHGASAPASATMGRVPARLLLESPVPVLLSRTALAPRTACLPRAASGSRARFSACSPPARPAPREPTSPLVVGGWHPQLAERDRLIAAPHLSRRPAGLHWAQLGIASVAVMVGCLIATQLKVPYYAVGGTTLPANAMVRITGAPRHEATGALLVPIVTIRRASLAGAVEGWVAGDTDLRSAREVLGDQPGAARQANLELMEAAKQTAIAVALRQLGSLVPASAHVEIDSQRLGGPSAGLAFALEIIDVLTPGELAGRHRVAVTGTLDRNGRVGAVGGISQKTMAARRARAQFLLVPTAAYPEAAADAGGRLQVIAVDSLSGALRALRAIAGDPP
jgi:PDZ domain-containing secreted protein/nucleotide-binding universal stress UspA family protein